MVYCFTRRSPGLFAINSVRCGEWYIFTFRKLNLHLWSASFGVEIARINEWIVWIMEWNERVTQLDGALKFITFTNILRGQMRWTAIHKSGYENNSHKGRDFNGTSKYVSPIKIPYLMECAKIKVILIILSTRNIITFGTFTIYLLICRNWMLVKMICSCIVAQVTIYFEWISKTDW